MNNEQPKIIYFDKPKHLSLDKIKKNDIISMPILGFEDVQPIKAIINKTEMDCVVEKDGEKIALVFISCQVLKDEKIKKVKGIEYGYTQGYYRFILGNEINIPNGKAEGEDAKSYEKYISFDVIGRFETDTIKSGCEIIDSSN